MKKITQTLTVPDNWKQKPMYYPVEIDGKWQRQKVQVEEIDLPALLKRQRHICGGVYLKSDTHDHRDEGYTNADIHDDIINAPSPLDDYKARSVDFEPTDTP